MNSLLFDRMNLERNMGTVIKRESIDSFLPAHDGVSSQQNSPRIDTLSCSGDEDGNSSEHHRSTPNYECGLVVEPRAKKRRKQSNPVRYHTSPAMPVLDSEEGEEEGMEEKAEEGICLERRSEEPEELEFKYHCPHCSSPFETDDQLKLHIEEEHVQKLLEKQLQQQSQNKSTSVNGREGNTGEAAREAPTSDANDTPLQLCVLDKRPAMTSPTEGSASESKEFPGNLPFPLPNVPPLVPLTQSGDAKCGNLPVPLNIFPNPITPFMFPVLPQGQNPTIPNGNPNPGVRIFNPEAYCELCNKEFCNKYFLKTHKANKHGIYSVDSLANTSYAGAFFTPSCLGNTPLPMQQMMQSPPSDPPPPPRPSVINMESYCEICQKEFCNKYFLKKHKQKIHGITDPSAQTLSPSNPVSSSETKGGSHSGSNSPASCNTSDKVAPQDLTCDICRLEFPSSFSLQNHKYAVHGSSAAPPLLQVQMSQSQPPTLPPTSAPPSLPLSHPPPPPSTTTSSQVPTTSSSVSCSLDAKVSTSLPIITTSADGSGPVFTPEKLREMGVINADAFCEICCKEFCNKYFLRTHKLNKHGIGVADSPSGKPQQPLSLTNAEKGDDAGSITKSNEESSQEQFPLGMCHSNTNASDMEPSGELSCEICNRPFSSFYLLKMHRFYTHNIPYVKEEDTSKDGSPTEERNLFMPQAAQPEEKDGAEASRMGLSPHPPTSQESNAAVSLSEDQASQDLQKLQSMIKELNASAASDSKTTCSLCRLEFDNKYFLRAHMMNEHGTLPVEDGNVMGTLPEMQRLSERSMTFPGASSGDSEAYCELCQKEFCSKYFLKTHRQNIHGIPSETSPPKKPGTSSSSSSSLPSLPYLDGLNRQQQSSRALTPSPDNKPKSHTGRNYCSICNKELCNKYFMKTHMLKMHGINLDEQGGDAVNSSIIGGVTCDICQKELCSKYFLKVHKQNTHGIFEEPSPPKDSMAPVAAQEKDASSQGIDGSDSSNRYFSHYTEVCPLCDRRFKSIKWLKTHMVNDHSDMLKDNMCSRIDNIISDLSKMCVLCGQSFAEKVALQIHLIKDHRITTEELGVGENSGMKTTADSSSAVIQDQLTSNGSSSPASNTFSLSMPRPGSFIKRPGSGSTRIYHCSYCTYSTRWLSNLYAHEKRHTGINAEGEKRFVCRICHRAYRYNHSLQRHLLNHRAAGISLRDASQSTSLVGRSRQLNSQELDLSRNPSEKHADQTQQSTKVKRYRCSKCNKKFRTRELCLAHIHALHSEKRNLIGQPKTAKPFRCLTCGFASKAWSILKIHINKYHPREKSKEAGVEIPPNVYPPPDRQLVPKSGGSSTHGHGFRPGYPPTSTAPPLPNGPNLPMSYAMPQNPPSAGSFIMQPFLIAQPQTEGAVKSDTFVPSLVYLPVCQKVLQPVTVAFTLTPA